MTVDSRRRGKKKKKEGYSQTTALGNRGLYRCQQHHKWRANELSLREMIMSSETIQNVYDNKKHCKEMQD